MRKDFIDITGKRSGMLVAINIETKLPGKRIGTRGAIWKCLCDCGKYCLASGGDIRTGRRKSCGCLREKNIENSGINRLLSEYKSKARSRAKWFNLSKEDFYKLIKGNCAYCGRSPEQILHHQKLKNKIQIIYNGIDRVDPRLGYKPENCVSCCKLCNRIKGTLTMEEFKKSIERIHKCLTNGL